MSEKTEKELTSRTIPGITWKQVVAFTVIIAAVIVLYVRLETLANKAYEQGVLNGELLKEIQGERKEERTFNDTRMSVMEQTLKTIEIRITILETQLDQIQDNQINRFK
jgi:hypothetical protein